MLSRGGESFWGVGEWVWVWLGFGVWGLGGRGFVEMNFAFLKIVSISLSESWDDGLVYCPVLRARWMNWFLISLVSASFSSISFRRKCMSVSLLAMIFISSSSVGFRGLKFTDLAGAPGLGFNFGRNVRFLIVP
jgi:hypothetical protein